MLNKYRGKAILLVVATTIIFGIAAISPQPAIAAVCDCSCYPDCGGGRSCCIETTCTSCPYNIGCGAHEVSSCPGGGGDPTPEDILGRVSTYPGTATRWQSPSNKCGSQYPISSTLKVSNSPLEHCNSGGPYYHFRSHEGNRTVSVSGLPPGYTCGNWFAYPNSNPSQVTSGSGCTANFTIAEGEQYTHLWFRIKPPCVTPPKPSGLSPSGTTSCGLTNLTFRWNAVSGATQYYLRINDTSNGWTGTCSSVNPGDTCTTVTNNSYTRSVVPGRTYSWWVHSVNSCGYSSASSATATVPACSSQCSSPASGSSNAACGSSGDLTAQWQWGAVSGATQYRLQIDNNSNFSSINYNITTSSTSHSRSIPDGTWYARVRVEQSSGSCISPSAWRTLPIISQTCAVATPTTAPSQCNPPSRPADPPATSCTSGSTYSATWEWNAVWDSAAGRWSTQYQLQVDNSSSFSSINYDTGWRSAATFGCASGGRCRWTTTGLTSGVRYYSRARARGVCTTSNWSSTVSVYRSCTGPTPTPTTATCNFCGDTAPCSGTQVCDSAPGICRNRLSRNQGDCDCNANCTTNFCYQRAGTDYCCNPGETWQTGVGCTSPVSQCQTPNQPVDPPTSPCAGNTYSATWRWQAIWDPEAGDWSARYQVQVDTESTFTSPLFQDTNWLPASSFGCANGGLCQWTTDNLQSGTRYYSRLRAWGDCSPSNWSNTVSVIKTCEGGVIGNIVDAGPGLTCSDLTSTPVSATVQATGPENLPPQTGTSFSYTNILPGTYNFSVSNPPAEYTTDGALYCESPTDPVPSSFVDVTSGETTDLTIGLVGNAAPWWQSQDGDILAQGVTSPIPAGCTSSAGCQPYISLIGSGGQPGVIAYQSTYNDGAGDPSTAPYGWLVQQGATSTDTSYSQLLSRVSGQTESIDSVASDGQISGALLKSQVPNQQTKFLTYDGNLTITSGFDANQRNIILFINGDLTIQGSVNFDDGQGLVGFIANGNIVIDRNINGGSAANPALEGIFFAQNQFITLSNKDAAPPSNDNTLYVRGSVVGTNGINFRRDLDYDNTTGANNTQPAEVVIFAPDILFTFPQALRGKEFIWEQVPS